jgi:hypothetical protein
VQIKDLLIKKFNNFKEIKFDCQNVEFDFELIQFIPNTQLILDKTLNLSNLKTSTNALTIHFVFLNGIDIDANTNLKSKSDIFMDLSYSKFRFFSNESLFNESSCSKYKRRTKNFLTKINTLVLRNYVSFNSKLCPYLFEDSFLNSIFIGGISNTFLNKNKFEFFQGDDQVKSLAHIDEIHLDVSYESLTSKQLHKILFENIKYLAINRLLNDIEADLFKDFNYLMRISLQLYDFKEFFSNGNLWFDYLRFNGKNYDLKFYNTRNNANILHLLFQHDKLTVFNKIYDYPDQDFCLFHHFPHEKLIYPVVDPTAKINCSCTVLYLIQFTPLYYKEELDVNTTHDFENNYYYFTELGTFDIKMYYCFQLVNYNTLLSACNFRERIKKCNKSSFKANKNENSITNDLNVINVIKWFEYVLLIVLNPMFAFAGLVSNSIVIVVIRNFSHMKKEQLEQSSLKSNKNMFTHIKVNSIFNCIYCMIVMLKLINECLYLTSDVYCSKLAIYPSSQSFKIIVQEFMGNIIKTCCNLSYIGIVFSRFILISKKTNGIYNKFSKASFFYYSIMVLTFGVAMSLFKLFQYKINHGYFSFGTFDFPEEIRSSVEYCSTNKVECQFFEIMKLFNNLLNDVLMLILTLIIDILLLKNYGEMLIKKKKISYGKANKANEAKHRITKMVIINGMIYFVAHLPELSSVILLYIFRADLFEFCLYSMT